MLHLGKILTYFVINRIRLIFFEDFVQLLLVKNFVLFVIAKE